MPDTISSPSAATSFVRFQEPYVSQGLNKKMNGVVPRGILRGGLLVTSGAGLNVRVDPDPDTNDSVYSYIDVSGHQLTFRQAGAITLDLSTVTGLPTDVYIALFVDYTVSTATVVEWRAYTIAELTTAPVAEAAFVIVLGRVTVPAVGPIPAANITPELRRESWDSVSKSLIPWQQIVENGRFDLAKVGAVLATGSALGWSLPSLAGSSRTWSISTAAPNSGLHELQVNGGVGFATVDVAFGDREGAVNAGDLVRVSFFIRGALWTGIGAAGVQGIQLSWFDAQKQFISNTYITDNTLTGTFAYVEIDEIVEAPASAAYVCYAVRLDPDALSPTGDLFFDDIRVWIQSNKNLEDDKLRRQGFDTLHPFSLEMVPTGGFANMGEFMDMVLRLGFSSGVPAGDVEYALRRMGGGGDFILDFVAGAIRELRVREGSELGIDLNTALPADHIIPRVVTNHEDNAAVFRTLLWEMGVTTPTTVLERVPIRVYHVREDAQRSENALEIAIGCSWDNATGLWTRDDATVPRQVPAKFVFGGAQLGYFAMNITVGPATWTDDSPQLGGGWDYNYFLVGGGGVGSPPAHPGGHEGGAGKVSLYNGSLHFNDPSTTESNPAPTSVNYVKNTLYAKTMSKAWGRMLIPAGAGGGVSPFVFDSFNVSSVVTGGLLGLDVTFLRPFDVVTPVLLGPPPVPPLPPAGEGQCIVACCDSPLVEVSPTTAFKGVGGVHLVFSDTTTGAAIDVSALITPITVYFEVKGQQT